MIQQIVFSEGTAIEVTKRLNNFLRGLARKMLILDPKTTLDIHAPTSGLKAALYFSMNRSGQMVPFIEIQREEDNFGYTGMFVGDYIVDDIDEIHIVSSQGYHRATLKPMFKEE